MKKIVKCSNEGILSTIDYEGLSKMTEKKSVSKSPNQTGGPVVKTGPTAGQNRSRNQDGRWRAKRSDAGISRKQ